MSLIIPSGGDKLYAGEVIGTFIGSLFNDNVLVKSKKAYVREGFTDKLTIPVSSSQFKVQPYASTPTSNGNYFQLKDRTMQLTKYNLYYEWNPLETLTYWKQYQPVGELVLAELPPELFLQMLSEMFSDEAEYHSRADWMGDVTRNDEFKIYDGILTQIKNGQGAYANAHRLDIAPVGNHGTSGFTETSVKTILENTRTYIRQQGESSEINKSYDSPDWAFHMSKRMFDRYSDEQKSQSYKGIDFTRQGVPLFDEKPIIIDPNFPDYHIFGAASNDSPTSNIQIGVNSQNAVTTYLEGRVAPNSDDHFVKLTPMRATMVVKPERTITVY